MGGADHAHTHLLRRAVLRNPRSQWRKGGANQRGGLPRLSMEWAHRVSSDAVCRSICSERSQGSAPHQRDASRSFNMRKEVAGHCPLSPETYLSSQSSREIPCSSRAAASSLGSSPVSVCHSMKPLARLLLSLGVACPWPDKSCRRNPAL